MAKNHKKEYSIEDYGILFLSPILSLVSGYMYLVTRTDRYAFGSLIGEHVSNFFGTALAMYLVTAITTAIEKNSQSETLKKMSVYMQIICAISLIGLNINFEVWKGNNQMVGDMTSALIALSVIWINTRYALDELSN